MKFGTSQFAFAFIAAFSAFAVVSSSTSCTQACTDDVNLTFQVGQRKDRKCLWVSNQPELRCNKNGKKDGKTKKLKTFCPAACDNCPTTNNVVVETDGPSCKDNAKLKFKVGKKQRNCAWVSKKSNQRCKKKTKRGGKKVALKTVCPAACDNCPTTTSDDDNVVVRPTNAPIVAPTKAPMNTPTKAPVSNNNGGDNADRGCCSLNYKDCIDYCGDDYNSCMACNGDKLGWISIDASLSTCTKRWQGCDSNNDCCDGLTCNEANGWSSCQPGNNNDNNNSSPTNNPVPQPTKAPVPNPTKAPVTNPTQAPVVSQPTGGDNNVITKKGKATFYGGNPSGGACGYNDLPQVSFPKGFSVAIGGDEFNDGYGCGACYEITCVGPFGNNPSCGCGGSGTNKVIVQATDQCPECGSTHFDLNTEAFTSIVAGQSSSMAGTCGIIETQFRRVSCDFKSNIRIRSKSGTSGYWYGLHVDDVAGYGAVQKIQLREAGKRNSNGFDIVCDKSQGASFWICDRKGRQIFAPLDVKLTDSAGRVLSSNDVITNLAGNQEFDFRKNYGPIDGDKSNSNNSNNNNNDDESPVSSPTKSPNLRPTKAPVSSPTRAPTGGGGNGCCSQNHKECIDWCGSSYDSCMTCTDPEGVIWLNNGALQNNQCIQRWDGCEGNSNGCCDGLTCQDRVGHGYKACLPGGESDPTPAPKPTNAPTNEPTIAPVPTISPAPTPEMKLLSTDQAMNAWDVFLGLDAVTYKNSPTNYAFVASGGAAGGGNLVVSEGQAYGLLITGSILASWDTHAGRVNGAKRSNVLKYFEGYYNFWKQMCIDSNNVSTNCQSGGFYCKDDSTGTSSVCLPDWRHYKTGGSEATGPAPDADEDAIVGIMLAVKAVENDRNKPSWYDEARKWADASATAFYEFEVDKSKSGHRLVKLGSCWGGWENQGNNPSYHSPGSFRVMKDYQNNFPNNLRKGYSAVSQSNWKKLIDTSHDVLRAVQCSSDGALVPNWATIGVDGNGQIKHTGGSFSGSGTPQYEYGAEAARSTFRVALDAAFYPEMSSEWSPYLSSFNWRLDGGYRNGSFSSSSFTSCKGPHTNQNINMFGDWLNNSFISGPTFSALIAASTDIGNAEAMIDAAGKKMAQPLPGSYYPRSWAMITNLMLNGAMESAGNTLKQ